MNNKSPVQKVPLKEFLIKNTILIIFLIFILNGINSFVIDKIGSRIFSQLAHEYTADYIFSQGDRINSYKKIEDYNGFIVVLDQELNVDESNYIEIDHYSTGDLIALINGTYKKDDVEYYGSFKLLGQGDDGKIGIVAFPKNIIERQTTISISPNEGLKIILFYLLKIILTLTLVAIVILVNSKRVSNYLLSPIFDLTDIFEDFSEKDSIQVDQISDGQVKEYSDIIKSFKKASKSLDSKMQENIDSRSREKQLFVDIRHDLKTPITIIETYSKAMIDGKIPQGEKNKYIESILKNAQNIDSLTNQLLDIVEFERDDYNLIFKKVDICEYFRKSIIDHLSIFESHQIKIDVIIPDHPIFSLIDSEMFDRVIRNLFFNVVNHNDEGINLLLELKDQGPYVKLIVADSGKEIGEDLKDKLFDLMVIGDKSRKNTNGSNGIGLYISKRIVESHQGKIYLEENYKNYTKAFIIDLAII